MTPLRLPGSGPGGTVDPREVIRWAAERFSGRIAASSSFQTQSMPLLHMIGEAAPEIPILFLDTGYHFPETLAFRDRIVEEWGLDLRVLRATEKAQAALAGERAPPYETDPDKCCWVNKVEPMRRAMGEYDAWISGIRRDQTGNRSGMGLLEKGPRSVLRVHPLIEWSTEDIREYIVRQRLPEHPLTSLGYASIGCAPCTRRLAPGEMERAGRWEGLGKTECGLHTDLVGADEEQPDMDGDDGRPKADEPAVPPAE